MAFLLDTLEQEDPDAGATAVVGISKLMLSGLITDEEVRLPSPFLPFLLRGFIDEFVEENR